MLFVLTLNKRGALLVRIVQLTAEFVGDKRSVRRMTLTAGMDCEARDAVGVVYLLPGLPVRPETSILPQGRRKPRPYVDVLSSYAKPASRVPERP